MSTYILQWQFVTRVYVWTGKVLAGDQILSVGTADVSGATLEEVMERIAETASSVSSPRCTHCLPSYMHAPSLALSHIFTYADTI